MANWFNITVSFKFVRTQEVESTGSQYTAHGHLKGIRVNVSKCKAKKRRVSLRSKGFWSSWIQQFSVIWENVFAFIIHALIWLSLKSEWLCFANGIILFWIDCCPPIPLITTLIYCSINTLLFFKSMLPPMFAVLSGWMLSPSVMGGWMCSEMSFCYTF